MNRISHILTLLLAAQLLLAATVFWPREQQGENDARAALLNVDGASVERIAISDSDNTVILQREGDGWVLPEYHSLPVDSTRLPRVLQQLPQLSRGWPVANSGAAAVRFEVSPEKYQRQVQYFQDEAEAGKLFIGTSPGFRKVHVRIDDTEPVYAVEFNSFDLPAEATEWLDKNLLRVNDITAIQGLDYSLELSAGSWVNADGNSPAQAEVDKLLNGLTSLRVNGAVDIATAAMLDSVDAPATLTLMTATGERAYRLYEIKDAYYVQRADIPVYFSISALDYDRLNDVNAESLYPASSENNENAAEDSVDEGNAN
ncbi:MAG: DUF4340 domain-containing protein [Halieaceae bacterium]